MTENPEARTEGKTDPLTCGNCGHWGVKPSHDPDTGCAAGGLDDQCGCKNWK